jgi:phenylalanyl-tRNA synthetase beta chain
MKVPLSWLKEYIPLTQSPEEIAEALTSLGLEVDAIQKRELAFSGVVVAKIVEIKPHPNADRLRIAIVSDGLEELQVVCAATNCRPGIKTALAKIGAKLPEKEGKSFTVKKGKLRDVESFGMLCASDELGLAAQKAEGILEFEESTIVGTDLQNLYSDTIFEISLTPNLGHDLSILGVARELSAKFCIPLKIPEVKVHETNDSSIEKKFQLNVLVKELCPQYACRFIQNVKVGPSPDWLRSRLEAAGQQSINNLVDIGNYVMLETGQPLHFFDADKIEMNHVIVDQAKKEEPFVLLDGTECRIPTHTILIRDEKKTLAIAGVMGGKSSAISETTTNILIESARFSPSSIRIASKALGLRTEASYRFERSTDPSGVLYALERASSLTEEICKTNSAKGILKSGDFNPLLRKINCRIPRLNTFLGTSLSSNEISSILERLFLKVESKDQDLLVVAIPTFRNDLHIEEDLFEEVARLYGYNNIPKSSAKHINATFADDPFYTFEHVLRNHLVSTGLQEVITCDLISPTEARLTFEKGMGEESLISVLQPSSIDLSVLRPSLLPGMLKIIRFNQDRGASDLSVFEIGKIHFKQEREFKERPMAAIVLQGKSAPYNFNPKPRSVDFFDLKGIIETLLLNFKIPEAQFSPCHLHSFHPFRQAKIKIEDSEIGVLGEIHPELLLRLEIKEPLYFAELDLLAIMHRMPKEWHCVPVPSFPGSQRDWTITVKETMPIHELFEAIRHVACPFLESVTLLDIYQSEQLGAHKKNVTLRLDYLDRKRTMDQTLVDQEHTKLKERVAEKLRDYVL